MTTPSFWKWSEWAALWPRLPAGSVPVFDVSGTSSEFQSTWNTTARLLAICNAAPGFHEPVSVKTGRQVALAMEEWVESPPFLDLMTLPPTRRGFRAALAVELRRSSPSSVAFVLALTRPADVAAVLEAQADARLAKDWQIVKAAIQHPVEEALPASSTAVVSPSVSTPAPSSPAPSSPAPSSHSPSSPRSSTPPAPPQSSPRVASPPPEPVLESSLSPVRAPAAAVPIDKLAHIPTTDKPRPTPSAAVQDCSIAMASWVDNALGQNPSVAREEIGKEIKAAALATKGAGAAALNYWFEDVGFPALCLLPPETAKALVDLWPDPVACTFNDPIRSMDNLTFWRAIRFTASKSMRVFIVDEALPRLVRSDWDAATRLAMLDPMTAAARDPTRGWLFEERLRLWKAFGGRLDAPVALEPDPGASLLAGGSRSTTARLWLESQARPNWNAVLAREPLDSRADERPAVASNVAAVRASFPMADDMPPFDLPEPPSRRGPRGP